MDIRKADDDLFPLEAPGSILLPRQFGVRGLLILTAVASVLMAILRMKGVSVEGFINVNGGLH